MERVALKKNGWSAPKRPRLAIETAYAQVTAD